MVVGYLCGVWCGGGMGYVVGARGVAWRGWLWGGCGCFRACYGLTGMVPPPYGPNVRHLGVEAGGYIFWLGLGVLRHMPMFAGSEYASRINGPKTGSSSHDGFVWMHSPCEQEHGARLSSLALAE